MKKLDKSDLANSYKSSSELGPRTHMCQVALTGAHKSFDLNLKDIILYSVAHIIPIYEINSVPSLTLSLNIKEHHPPALFLAKSSFLL
jgi:hypothetical protein